MLSGSAGRLPSVAMAIRYFPLATPALFRNAPPRSPFEAKWHAAAQAITEQRRAKQYALSLTLYRCEVAAQQFLKLVRCKLEPMIGICGRRRG